MRRMIAQTLVVILLLVWTIPPAQAQQGPVGFAMLVQLEELLYGKEQDGAFLTRLERMEMDILGQVQSQGAFLVRMQRLNSILTGSESGPSLSMKLNAVEWAMFQEINEGPTISRRLDQLEMAMFGQADSNTGLMGRLDNLLTLMWPGGKIYDRRVDVPAGTLVRVELLTELNSESSQVLAPIRYRVVDDVLIGQNVVIPAGAIGEGQVISVSQSGRLGKDGLVEVDFGSVRAIDGTRISINMDEKATEKNQSLELAAGASIAGVVLLGPIGLAAGYFVRGKAHIVPAGTKFYVEVSQDTSLRALSLTPTN